MRHESERGPAAVMASLPFSLIGVFLALLVTGTTLNIFSMIGGMLPLALGPGEGGEMQAPMGRAIIGGVITSTLLTLVVVPVLYAYVDDWRERRQSLRLTRRDLCPDNK
jgi:multidrug efflux pump subunit AcrB